MSAVLANLIPIGVAPTRLSKQQSPFCEVRLVDADDRDVAVGVPGELCMRGPSLFSGYWRAPETNAMHFRGGWFIWAMCSSAIRTARSILSIA